MSSPAPLETLYDRQTGTELPLTQALTRLYGSLRFPPQGDKPHVIANFVETLDGVTSLAESGNQASGAISGHNEHDRMVMGLLRAASDAVIVGAGTARSVPKHIWIAEHIFSDLAAEYREVRRALGKREQPLNVIVSASGDLDLGRPVYSSGVTPVLIATTSRGARRILDQPVPQSVEVNALADEGSLNAKSILEAAARASGGDRILVEGGPRLLGDFIAEDLLGELFLTLAPQIAGRGRGMRPGLVAGHTFAPEDPRWGTLISVKRAGYHLFLRYSFDTSDRFSPP